MLIKPQRPRGWPCSPEGMFQKDVAPSWLGLFPACVMLAFSMLSITMQIHRQPCKNAEHALSHTLSATHIQASVPHWLYGCSLFDVFPHWIYAPPSIFFLFLSPLSLSLPSFVRHLFTLDQPCRDSWLQRATSFISHSSGREGHSALR